MKDYRELSDWEKAKVDKAITEEIEPKHHLNKNTGFEYDEPDYTRSAIHKGHYCSECWMTYYGCLCSHE